MPPRQCRVIRLLTRRFCTIPWQFSVDEAEGRINNNLALYTANKAGTFSEQPRAAGGLLIPLIYIDAYIQGRKLDTLPGGFNQVSN